MLAANYKRKAPPASNTNTGVSSTSETISATASSNSGVAPVKAGSNPTTIQINNIPVHFPFKPYDVQTKYMQSVLDALQGGQHALLESPTGTGKTLCLLCSTLAWQQAQKGLNNRADAMNTSQSHSQGNASVKTPVIIYASRTHSQLSQVVREMKNTRYRPRHAVLGSREHMCIHPKVNPQSTSKTKPQPTSSDINHSCNKLNKERKCMYRNTLDEHGPNWHPPCHDLKAGDENQPVRDMEDLVTAGKENRVCPFYYTRGLISNAEIIFVPYNYLFDRDARETTLAEVDFANSILIFDEAHNLEEFASESSSFDLSSNDIAGCVHEVQRALQYLELNPDTEGGGSKLKDNMLRLKSIFLKLETFMVDGLAELIRAKKTAVAPTGESSHSGEFMFDIFREGAGITHGNSAIFCAFVKQVQELILEFKGSSSSSATPRLDHFVNCLKRVFGTGSEMLAVARSKSYRVHVTKVQQNTNGGFSDGRTISYWCFAPSLAMRELAFLKVRSILITSGTLSPLPSFSMELGLDFPIQLENKHVIKPEQIFVRVIGKGVSGKQLSSKFGRRDDPEYIMELGNTLASLCRNIPGGVLVFFPSYSSMQTCVERWGGPSNHKKANDKGGQFFAARKKPQTLRYSFPQMPTHFMAQNETSTPWKRLLSRKAIVLEPRTTSDLNDAIAEFKKFISLPKSPGCILMGVCRGKISEGIDFTDDMCRAVVVTGLPFAPYLDPKVKLKRDFLDAAKAGEKTPSSIDGGFGNGNSDATSEKPNTKKSTTLSGAEWYNQQAHRAVNQAIGRAIRHRNDYGAVLFLDHRFSEPRNCNGLSKWLRPHLIDESFGASTRGIVGFFKEAKAKADESRVRPVLRYEEPSQHVSRTDTGSIENQVTQIAVISSSHGGANTTDSFIPESLIKKRFDLNDISSKDVDTSSKIQADEKATRASTLADAYSKDKPPANPLPMHEEGPSIWNDLSKSGASNTQRPIPSKLPKDLSTTRRSRDDAKQQAKTFFDCAKQILSKEDLLKTQQLLVGMKAHGDTKDSQSYVKTAKELLLLLAGVGRIDRNRMNLISLLYPLLPGKFRYSLEKLGRKLCFERSRFYELCKSTLTETDFDIVRKTTSRLMVDVSCSVNPIDDSTSNDRSILESLHKVLSVMSINSIDPNHLFDLLPQSYQRKAQAINIELAKEREMTKAKEHLKQQKGDDSVNAILFQRNRPKTLVPANHTEQPESEESQTNLTQALSKGKAITDEKKARVTTLQHHSGNKRTPVPSVATATKRVCKSAPDENTDAVDLFLKQVKQDVYKHRAERLNGKIKAHVPENFMCSICNTHAKEPLMAECRHSACMSCWKDWLSRQSTCPQCRKHTELKTLAKMVFATDGKMDGGFTQICESESDNDELEIVA